MTQKRGIGRRNERSGGKGREGGRRERERKLR